MAQSGLAQHTLCQIGIVVRDIERAAGHYAEVLGVPKPEIVEADTRNYAHSYKGERMQGRARLAFFQLGQVAIELIEPIGGPSTWRDYLDGKGQGVHHLAFFVKDMDSTLAELAGKGLPLVQRGGYKGGEYAYVDDHERLGVLIELLAETTAPTP